MKLKMDLSILLLILTSVSAANIRSVVKTEQETMICEEFKHPKCVKWDNTTQTCYNMNCWKYDSIKEECLQDGKPWLPAIILQGIPLTGIFGSGFGNIGRWDIFGMYMGVVFAPVAVMCVLCCIIMSKEEFSDNMLISCCTNCLSCMYGITLLTFWIWGIVVIASKDIDAPWTDHAGNFIMCPLV
jgi:hypothetical protein